MEIQIKIKRWNKNTGWVDRTVTFHKIKQQWQSNDGAIIIELMKAKDELKNSS